MKKGNFIELLQQPHLVNNESIVGLQSVLEEYPYFQTAQLLVTKAFHQSENLNFETSLRKSAAYASSREKLHELLFNDLQVSPTEQNTSGLESGVIDGKAELVGEINSEKENIEHVTEELNPITDSAEVQNSLSNPIDTEDVAVKNDSETTTGVENQVLEAVENELPQETLETESFSINLNEVEAGNKEVNNQEELDKLENQILATAISSSVLQGVSDDLPNINELQLQAANLSSDNLTPPLADSKPETKEIDTNSARSFSDWLKVYSEPLEENEIENIEVEEEKSSNLDLYASAPPEKTEFYSPSKMAKLSVQENDDLVTETLANIYADQGNYEKAISAFNKLQLKYPEKSSYFAGRIKTIQNQINL